MVSTTPPTHTHTHTHAPQFFSVLDAIYGATMFPLIAGSNATGAGRGQGSRGRGVRGWVLVSSRYSSAWAAPGRVVAMRRGGKAHDPPLLTAHPYTSIHAPHTDFVIMDSNFRTPYGTLMDPSKLRFYVAAARAFGERGRGRRGRGEHGGGLGVKAAAAGPLPFCPPPRPPL